MTDWLEIIIEVAGVFGVIGGLGGLLWQTRKDHRQRRKESTMNYVATVSRYRLLDRELSAFAGGGEGDNASQPIDKILADEGRSTEIFEMFAQMEEFATGVEQDVFDLDIINAAKGGWLLAFFERWRNYLNHRIAESSFPDKAFDQFEALIIKIADKRGVPRPARLER